MKAQKNLKHRKLRLALLSPFSLLLALWKRTCKTSTAFLTRAKSACKEQRKIWTSHEKARLATLGGFPIAALFPRSDSLKEQQERWTSNPRF